MASQICALILKLKIFCLNYLLFYPHSYLYIIAYFHLLNQCGIFPRNDINQLFNYVSLSSYWPMSLNVTRSLHLRKPAVLLTAIRLSLGVLFIVSLQKSIDGNCCSLYIKYKYYFLFLLILLTSFFLLMFSSLIWAYIYNIHKVLFSYSSP